MLIKCPECQLQVSDKAISCPHCGLPLKNKERKRQPSKKSTRRKRLPNGFGQITELKNKNLRKPFRAMVTVSKDEYGKPICKLLKPEAYFKTYNEAYAALVEYNRNPCDLEPSIIMQDLYERWIETYIERVSKNSIRSMTLVWPYCSSVYKMRVKDVRARHIKNCIDEGFILNKDGSKKYPSAGTKVKMKSMFNLILDYALEYEIVDRNYSRSFKMNEEIIKEKTKKRKFHINFTDEELNILWDNIENINYLDLIIIQCYSGWRPQELGLIKLEDVNINDWTFKGGMKTSNGTRIVPIHSKIRKYVKMRYDEAVELNSEYLFNCRNSRTGMDLTYNKYRYYFNNAVSFLKLNPEHSAHDGRVTFVTNAKKYKVDEYAIKYLVGHSINDITEKVYTVREIEWLRDEIEKIK